MKNIIVPFCFIILSTVTARAQDVRYSFKESYEVGAGAQVSVSSSDGNIEAISFEGTKADVFFIVKKHNKVLNVSRQDLEKEVDLEVVHSGNSLSIVVKYRNEFQSLNWNDKMVVSFRLQLPKDASCDLRTSDGNISMKGLRNNQKCRTSDGDLNISDIGGSLTASTSDGNIVIKNINGNLEAKTSDGNINVEAVKGDASASTSDGNISVNDLSGRTILKTSDGDISFKDLTGSLTATTSDGNVNGNLLQLTKELTIKTSDGNITVSIPDKLGLDLDIKGESLNIPLSNFSGRSDEKVIRGKSNGGGIPVNLSTSGNVKLTYH